MPDPLIRSAIPARQPWQPGRTGMPEPGGYVWHGQRRPEWATRMISRAEAVYGKPHMVCLACGGPMVTSVEVRALHCAACGAGYQSGTEGLPR